MKRLILFFTTVLLFVFTIGPTPTRAFSAVLGARVIGDEGVSIDGYQADNPESPITLDDSTPTFSGYTIPNASLLLIIRSEPIERETLSDATGYWSYTFDEPLVTGRHTLSLKVTDQYGITSKEVLAATFTVPEVKGESITPPLSPTSPPIPKNPKVNYLTISLVVIGSLALLGVLYFYLARKPKSDI
jgi:hypothetical protein